MGPDTAPTVVAHTTRERSRERVLSLAISVAANRDWRLTAVPTPMRARPTSNSGKKATIVDTMVTIAPEAARSAPVNSEILRPDRPARRASGTAARAAPRVDIVAAIPDQASEPESLLARIAPMESVAPMPRPAIT